MHITLRDIRKLNDVKVIGEERLVNARIAGVSTDSRAANKGKIFFALRGERFDGHSFVPAVLEQDVAAVVVAKEWSEANTAIGTMVRAAIVVVPDTTHALGELAALYRAKFRISIIAVGGSNGKTTTKDMIAAVLRQKYRVLATEGNLNNHVGVPLTVFRLRTTHDVAVLELGTNHPGELAYLCQITQPTHALVTNIGKEHLEFFGDTGGVATEETELYRFVATHGVGFVNADDPVLRGVSRALRRRLMYAAHHPADVRGTAVRLGPDGYPRFTLRRRGREAKDCVRLHVAGMHNVSNALGAAAVGFSFRVPRKAIITALEEFTPASRRMEIIERNGVTILNDTYNANPDSTAAALQTLGALRVVGKKIVVLADMLELGAHAEEEHKAIGTLVRRSGFAYLLTFGSTARRISESSGIPTARSFNEKGSLIAALKELVCVGDAVLVKGSRGMRMEDVVDALQQ